MTSKGGRAARWSRAVKTKWHPEAGTFKKPYKQLARIVADASKSLKQAENRLTYYQNRAGSNLSSADKKNIEKAKVEVRRIFHAEAPKKAAAKKAAPKTSRIVPSASSPFYFRWKGDSVWYRGKRIGEARVLRYLGRKAYPSLHKAGKFHAYTVMIPGRGRATLLQAQAPKS